MGVVGEAAEVQRSEVRARVLAALASARPKALRFRRSWRKLAFVVATRPTNYFCG